MAIHGLRRPAVMLLVASLAALVLVFSPANDTARAVQNNVGYPSSLSDPTPGANANITTFLQLPAPTSFPEGGTVAGTPNGFGVATDTADLSGTPVNVPDGTSVGTLTATVNLALNVAAFNSCFVRVPIPFAMVDATVSTATTIGGSPTDTTWIGNLDVAPADGSPDAVTKWPTYLDAHLANLNPGGSPPVPIARYHGQFLVVPPSETNLELLIFAAGSIPDYPASMGGLSVSILEDSLAPPSPSGISMNCTAFAPTVFTATTIFGSSAGEAVLDGANSLVQFDPVTGALEPGAEACFDIDSGEDLDEELDATDDEVDVTGVLPPKIGDIIAIDAEQMEVLSISVTTLTVDRGFGTTTATTHSTGTDVFIAFANVDDDGDGTTDEGCGFLLRENPSTPGSYLFSIASTTGRDTDNDGIENALDKCPLDVDANIVPGFGPGGGLPWPSGPGYNPRWPAPVLGTQPQDLDDDNLPLSCDPSTSPSPTGGCCPLGVDEDVFTEGAGFSNGQDNCPLVGNPSQANTDLLPIDIGPRTDNMGDACDPNPSISDGHAHRDFGLGPVCIGGTDDDGDGWCFSDDPDDDDAALQTEDIAFERTCTDGIDNDDDGDTDLDDTACQLPDHDACSFRRISGSRDVSNGQSNSAQIVIKNNTDDPDVCKVAFLIDTTSGGLADGCGVTITGLVSDGLVAGTDEVGFINHDSGGYPSVQLAPLHTPATDLELEAFATADIAINGHAASPVKILTTYSCTGTPAEGPADFTISVDLCHLGDVTLGLFGPLFPLGDDCGLIGSDGGQDRVNQGNDATQTKNVDVEP